METIKTIYIKNYSKWSSISWRNTWNKVRKDLVSFYDMWIKINLDFSWIENVTHSFIDEVIWIFVYYDYKKALEIFKFSNCNEDIKNTIRFVFADRKNESKTAC